MGSANPLPMELLMPSSFTNIREIALKTVPSASKVEIKRVLESLRGFEVVKVRTLNVKGKKKHRGGSLIAKPDYKKAYVTLKRPLSIVVEEGKDDREAQPLKLVGYADDGGATKFPWTSMRSGSAR